MPRNAPPTAIRAVKESEKLSLSPRARTTPTERITVYLDRELVTDLRMRAAKERRSLSALVEEALKAGK
jgi:predicted HicB family RNase H-like nuclease